MKITIDRFEGDLAVAELSDGSFANLPRVFVPNAREGDIINIEKDIEATEAAHRESRSRLHSLFGKHKDQ
jgi:hypothetical protein